MQLNYLRNVQRTQTLNIALSYHTTNFKKYFFEQKVK